MQEIFYDSNGLAIIPSLKEQVAHGFSWGSEFPNMSYRHGEKEEVQKAEDSFLRRLGLPKTGTYVAMSPEHGVASVVVGKNVNNTNPECDVLMTNEKNVALAVKPADCLVAIFTTRKDNPNRCFAVVHAGRIGVGKNVVAVAVEALKKQYGVNPHDLLVGVTPGITIKNHAVKSRADLVNPESWSNFSEDRDGVVYVDMYGLFRKQCIDAGIFPEHIAQYEVDTFDAAVKGESFSHRYAQINQNNKNGRFMVAAFLD